MNAKICNICSKKEIHFVWEKLKMVWFKALAKFMIWDLIIRLWALLGTPVLPMNLAVPRSVLSCNSKFTHICKTFGVQMTNIITHDHVKIRFQAQGRFHVPRPDYPDGVTGFRPSSHDPLRSSIQNYQQQQQWTGIPASLSQASSLLSSVSLRSGLTVEW